MDDHPTIEQNGNSNFSYSDAEIDDDTNVWLATEQIQLESETEFSFFINDPDTFDDNNLDIFNNNDLETFNNNNLDIFNNNDHDTFNNVKPDISINKNDTDSIDDNSNILNLSNDQNQPDQIQQQQPQTCTTSSNFSSSFQNQPQQLPFPCIQTNFNIGSNQMFPVQPNQVSTQLHQTHSTNNSNFLIMVQQYLPQKRNQNSRSNKRSPFYKELMRIYSGNENTVINKYILNAIFKIINQIVNDKQFEKKYFNRDAQRRIFKCIDNYQNVAPLIFRYFTIFKEVGMIDYEDDCAAYKRFGKAQSRNLIGSYFQTKYELKKHLILQKNHS